jgi:hypothetical protein
MKRIKFTRPPSKLKFTEAHPWQVKDVMGITFARFSNRNLAIIHAMDYPGSYVHNKKARLRLEREECVWAMKELDLENYDANGQVH